MPADECLSYGIANKLFAEDELDQKTLEWARQLADGAPLAMAAAKKLLRGAGQISFSEAITAEGFAQTPLAKSNDFKIGVQAFFDKEKPVFSGN
ncbi:MAG: hypothetical protein GKR97_16730 [Rhizobiaceae bacterium]|nr:hypothetical protein [Rhizobiaceae bacterium]